MKHVDLTYINEISNGDKVFVNELIDIFISQVAEFNALFIKHYSVKDWDKLAKLAHKAKSSILSLGMSVLADDLKSLELVSKQLLVNELSNDDAISNRGKIEKLAADLERYPATKVKWVKENISESIVKKIIDDFDFQTSQAVEELRSITNK